MERPTSVSVIAWGLLVMSWLSFFAAANSIQMMTLFQFAIIVIALLTNVVSGIAMLNRFNWGRLLYVGSTLVFVVIEILMSPMNAAMMTPRLLIFAIITFFLFRPQANEYFLKKNAADAQEPAK